MEVVVDVADDAEPICVRLIKEELIKEELIKGELKGELRKGELRNINREGGANYVLCDQSTVNPTDGTELGDRICIYSTVSAEAHMGETQQPQPRPPMRSLNSVIF